MDSEYIEMLALQYEVLKLEMSIANLSLPQNKNVGSDTDLLLRNLDCAVIESLHAQRDEEGEKAFDSVRGLFTEGKEIYPGSGLKGKTHVQICVRNPNCIKGYFAPKLPDLSWTIP